MRARLLGMAAVLAAMLAAAAPAGAATSAGTDLHDARYCELLVLDHLPPDARVVVWNTIGLNDCPADWWSGFESGPLAQELGAAFVVINGPRNFLMDSAKARTGAVQDFHGKRMRRVATLPIDTVADLAQATYTDRTVSRTNTWHWRAGRRVFELLAPDGSAYVMQSYSQIVDPELAMSDLPGLGDRLALPEGWSYRTRRLKEPLTLRAVGSATILQDELRNTYQRLPDEPGKAKKRAVKLEGEFQAVGSPAPGQIEDQGTIRGKPVGSAVVRMLSTFGSDGTITGEITMESPRGDVFGSFAGTYGITGANVDIEGVTQLTGGTGRYRGIRGKDLATEVHDTLDGRNGTMFLRGAARF